jgi:hypothetical protein
MTFAVLLELLKRINVKQAICITLIFGLVAGLVVSRVQLGMANLKLEKAETERALALWNLDQSILNRKMLEAALEESNMQFAMLSDYTNQLTAALRDKSLIAAEMTARADELEKIKLKYEELLELSAQLPLCKVYEGSLKLIGGGQ